MPEVEEAVKRNLIGLVTAVALLAPVAGQTTSAGAQALGRVSDAPCKSGEAAGFPCRKVDLKAFVPMSELGGGGASDIWGWKDSETKHEYALMGTTGGLAFIDVTNPSDPIYLGKMPKGDDEWIWQDVEVYKDHAYVVCDLSPCGLQIFDLTRLRDAAEGTQTWTPDLIGTDQFTYKVNDGTEDSNIATVNITIDSINDDPLITAPNTVNVQQDVAWYAFTSAGGHCNIGTCSSSPSTGLSIFDVDATPSGQTQGPHLAVLKVQKGSFTLSSTTGLSFSAGDGVSDQHMVFEGNIGAIDSALTSARYEPPAGFAGTDDIRLNVNDNGQWGIGGGQDVSKTIFVNVTPITINRPPQADPKSITTKEDTPVRVDLTGFDPDLDLLTFAVALQPSHGTLTGVSPQLTYTPSKDYVGLDSFTYTASDGDSTSAPATVSITVESLADPPVPRPLSISTVEEQPRAFTMTADNPDNLRITWDVGPPGTGTIYSGGVALGPGVSENVPATMVYSPAVNQNGTDTFLYRLRTTLDGIAYVGEWKQATVSIGPNPDPPVPTNDKVRVAPGASIPITLKATDPDGDPLTYKVISQPSAGTLTGTPPNLTYTAPPRYWLTAFNFEVSDGLFTRTGTIELEVNRIQPDLTIRRASQSFFDRKGFDVFNSTGAGQTLNFDAPIGSPTEIVMEVYNRSLFADTIGLEARWNRSEIDGFDVRYFDELGNNITQAIGTGNYRIQKMQAHSQAEITARVTPTNRATGKDIRLELTANSGTDPSSVDVVVANMSAGTFRPDVKLHSNDIDPIGNDIYNVDRQSLAQRAVNGDKVETFLTIENDGTAPDSFILKGDGGPGDAVRYLLVVAGGTQDITAEVLAGTFKTGSVGVGQFRRVVMEVTVPNDPKTLPPAYRFSATSNNKPALDDTVEIVVEGFRATQPDLQIESLQRENGINGELPIQIGRGVFTDPARPYTMREVGEVGTSSVYVASVNPRPSEGGIYSLKGRVEICSGAVCQRGDAFGAKVRFWWLNPVSFSEERNIDLTDEILAGGELDEISGAQGVPIEEVWIEFSTSATTPVRTDIEATIEAFAVGRRQLADAVGASVMAVKSRPDNTICCREPYVAPSGGTIIGEGLGYDVYGNAAAQTITIPLGPADQDGFTFQVQNDMQGFTGSYQDRIRVRGTGSGNGFVVRYFDAAGADVTNAIVGGTQVLELRQGEVASFRAQVSSPSGARPGAVWPVTVTSTSLDARMYVERVSDTVVANARVVHRPDAALFERPGPAAALGVSSGPIVGEDVYSPASQVLKTSNKLGKTTHYTLRVTNDGSRSDTLMVQAEGQASGWQLGITDGTKDVTEAMRAGGYPVALGAGASKEFAVTVRAAETVREGKTFSPSFKVRSNTRPLSEADVVSLAGTATISCDVTDVTVGVVAISGPCIQAADNGYIASGFVTLNDLELSIEGGSAFIDRARQTLSAPGYNELRIDKPELDTFVRIPLLLANTYLTRDCGVVDQERFSSGGCGGGTSLGTPMLFSGNAQLIRGSSDPLGIEPNGHVYGLPLDAAELTKWSYRLTWKPGGAEVELPVPAPEPFMGAPAKAAVDLDDAPPRFVEVNFGNLVIDGLTIFNFANLKARYYLDTQEWLVYGNAGYPAFPAVPGFQVGAKFDGDGPKWILLRLKSGVVDVPVLPPHVMLSELKALVTNKPAVYGSATLDIWKLVSTKGPGGLLQLKGSFAYDEQRVGARGEVSIFGVIGPLTDAKVTAGRSGVRASMNWNYSVGLGSIDFGGDIGKLDLGRVGFDAALDGAGQGDGFEIEGKGSLQAFGQSVGLNAVISSIGAAGCATGSISKLGSASFGIGAKWSGGGVEVLTDCALKDYRDPDAPQHVDFAGFESEMQRYLAEADVIEALVQSLPEAAQLGLAL